MDVRWTAFCKHYSISTFTAIVDALKFRTADSLRSCWPCAHQWLQILTVFILPGQQLLTKISCSQSCLYWQRYLTIKRFEAVRQSWWGFGGRWMTLPYATRCGNFHDFIKVLKITLWNVWWRHCSFTWRFLERTTFYRPATTALMGSYGTRF